MPNMLDGMTILSPVNMRDTCPICGKAPHPDRTTTDKKENKGCLQSKPKNLGCTQIAQISALPNYATAAHHLIPAMQCLNKFPRLKQMCKTVGYDVNNSKNGLSLPTCGQKSLNAYRSSDGSLSRYGKLNDEDKEDVAFQIMDGLNMQWHVGHHNWAFDFETDNIAHTENYDKLVKQDLRQLEVGIKKKGVSICEPESGESGKKVIDQLNSLSEKIKGKVNGWTLYYVSAKAFKFSTIYR